VKCPKCNYLGFETGARCKNCGYDFSLLSVAESEPADYEIHPPAIDDVPVHVVDDVDLHDDLWLGSREEPRILEHDPPLSIRNEIEDAGADRFVMSLAIGRPPIEESSKGLTALPADELPPNHRDAPAPVVPFLSVPSVPSPSTDRPLPLFKRGQEHDDAPLIKLPAAPRPPLAVRRTPDTPRLRPVPRHASRPASPPVLQFSEEVTDRTAPTQEAQKGAPRERVHSPIVVEESRATARIVAVVIDHLILLGIDAAVVYFTLRMTGLSMEEWTTLPIAPMAAFLGLLKVSYFGAFTAVGGQTIGKMAVGTYVVADDGKPVDPAHALRRTLAGIVSFLAFGLGFIPALFGDHRALHDRLAGTRVVRLRSV
jgi:uncharacterized RDD family membrane protein YckC